MKTFIIADTHFGHANIIKYCNRPFKNVSEMNKTLIDHWNNIVSKDDVIYHLGDVSMKISKKDTKKIINQLNGYKILIVGNHDKYDYKQLGFDEVYNFPIFLNNHIILSHYPIIELNNFYNIHGHIHDKDMDSDNHFNVGVEKIGYTPVELNDILTLKNWNLDYDINKRYLLDFRNYKQKN